MNIDDLKNAQAAMEAVENLRSALYVLDGDDDFEWQVKGLIEHASELTGKILADRMQK